MSGARKAGRGIPGGPWLVALGLGVAALAAASGCARGVPPTAPGAGPEGPRFEPDAWIADDGARLPVTRWVPGGEPVGIVLALHGFGEHRDMFYALAPPLAAAGYEVVAYDQRGFGETAQRGYWPGRERLVADARQAWRALAQHRDVPVFLLGHSMGGAVAALAVTGPDAIRPAGTVLLAPAVHGWDTLPLVQRLALRIGAALVPRAAPRQDWGRAIARVQVTDDPVIRRIQAGDPRVLHAVPLEMLRGVVDLMDAAARRVPAIPAASLILYGARDEIIPAPAACAMLARLAERPPPRPRFALYPAGYHYLARDRQRARTIGDIRAWLATPGAPLPSGAERAPAAARERLCPDPGGPPDGALPPR